MSQGNIDFELKNSRFEAPTRTAVGIVNVADSTGVYPNQPVAILALIHSSIASTDCDEAGKYAYGCRLINTYPTGSTALINTGTVSVPSWVTLS